MLYEWHWTTYLLYVAFAFGTVICIRRLKRTSGCIQEYRSQVVISQERLIIFFIFFATLMILPMFRNLDLYPSYDYSVATGVRTIDPQAYVWQFLSGQNPGFNIKSMLTLSQTEPLLYSLAAFILSFGGGIQTVWFVVYGIVVLCYWIFFRNTVEPEFNYALFLPFFAHYLYSMSAIRSGLSFAFFYAAVGYLKKDRKLIAIIMLALGFSSHYLILFGILGLVFDYFIRKSSNKKQMVLLLFAICVVATVLFEVHAANIIAATKYRTYLEGGRMTVIGQIPVLVLFVLILFNYNKLKIQYADRMIFVNLSVFSAMMCPFVIIFGAYRVESYFLLARLYTWGMLLKLLAESKTIPGSSVRVRIFGRSIHAFDAIGGMGAFIWMTKQIYDMRGIGLMPLFSSFI